MPTPPPPARWAVAIHNQDFPSLRAWLRVQPDGLNQALMQVETAQAIYEERPLVWAIKNHRWSLANKLVSLGADPNALSADGKHTVMETVVATCCSTAGPWPSVVLELVENCLAHGGDPHVQALPINPPVLASCLSDTVHLSGANKKKSADPVRNAVALRIWEQTKDREWPAPAQWAAWFQVLRRKNQAWVQRLRLCGATPVPHDRTLVTTMAAELGRDLLGDRVRQEAAFEVLADFGMEWRANEHKPEDDGLRQTFAAAKARRLEQKWRAEDVPMGRNRGRL